MPKGLRVASAVSQLDEIFLGLANSVNNGIAKRSIPGEKVNPLVHTLSASIIHFGTQPSDLCPAIISFSSVSLPFTDTVVQLGHILIARILLISYLKLMTWLEKLILCYTVSHLRTP